MRMRSRMVSSPPRQELIPSSHQVMPTTLRPRPASYTIRPHLTKSSASPRLCGEPGKGRAMQTIDEQFTVATPELVEFGYEVAGVGSRFIAALIDTALIGIIYLLIQVAGLATSYGGQSILNQQ